MKSSYELKEQVVRLLAGLYGPSDANVIAVLGELDRNKIKDPADNIVTATIEVLVQKGRLALDPQIQRNLREFQLSHTEFNWHSANLLFVLGACDGDFSLAGLEYALSQVSDQLEHSPAYHAQVAADNRAANEITEAESIRAETLSVFEASKATYLRNSGNNFAGWNYELGKKVKSLAAMDISQLRTLEAQRDEKAALIAQAETSIAARTDARFRGATVQVGGNASDYAAYPKFPKTFYPRGSVTPVEYSPELLKHISNTDREWWSQLRNKYGAEQLASRLLGKE